MRRDKIISLRVNERLHNNFMDRLEKYKRNYPNDKINIEFSVSVFDNSFADIVEKLLQCVNEKK